ncbi:deoxyribodipyrimidine photo-lyase [Thalassotalea sp. G2M2-11]|uniref:deoxyribodipyrimidine photo-lyase n=1 Tax=Thalassotalea sp. G2M2-11 TaxID=2787627 RepID=UPI0019CF8C8D|nr:deoxyribodipyrimidine photo-lyase [Thalassotalea sp. G2M2-11]
MLLWFRHDIRVHDNSALEYFLTHRKNTDKAIYYVLDELWQDYHWSAIKIDFIKRHLELLTKQLAQLGIELVIHKVADHQAQVAHLSQYCQQHNIDTLVVNREHEINEVRRDQQLIKQGLKLQYFESDVIVPKGRVLNQSGEMFKVFTPFKKAWLSYVRDHGVDYIARYDQLGDTAQETEHSLSSSWPLVDTVEAQVIPQFLDDKLEDYHHQRDIPSIKGTSGLSPYLAIGVLSPRYLLRLLLQGYPDLLLSSDSSRFSWLNELIWREFYRHLLDAHPRLCMHQNFNQKYDHLRWRDDSQAYQAWCQGKTGYPLVDAAMRQLVQTGWMHNRLRMVVASFLTKHLLIDWRLGEQFFMQHLIDGDLAANNGGWQWAASTGCDAQPYFRVFNPIRQSERFDPKGDFIRKYIPELNDVPNKHIHFPHYYLADKQHQYWPAIVEHKAARERAIAFFKG